MVLQIHDGGAGLAHKATAAAFWVVVVTIHTRSQQHTVDDVPPHPLACSNVM